MPRHHPCLAPPFRERAEPIVRTLARRERTIICAESCTAGLLSAALSQADGASDVLHGGFVTYTKDHKTKALGVPRGLLARSGSVTADIAERMARGALRHSQAHVALAVTGVLGPMPDEDGNPVGLVYFCCAVRGRKPRTLRKQFPKAPHDELRYRAVLTALGLAARTIGARR